MDDLDKNKGNEIDSLRLGRVQEWALEHGYNSFRVGGVLCGEARAEFVLGLFRPRLRSLGRRRGLLGRGECGVLVPGVAAKFAGLTSPDPRATV